MNATQKNGTYILSPTAEELATLDRAHTEFGPRVLSDLVADYCQAWQRAFTLKDKQALVTAYEKAPAAEKQAMMDTAAKAEVSAAKVGG